MGFADDLLLFCRADFDSIRVFKEGFDWFAKVSGLRLNVQKSHLIISRSAQELKDQMLEILGFQEGHLPMRYLGLPLISSRLSISDCEPLISKIDARITGWEGISLSYAGRVQIIKSVLSTLSLYWVSAFILPKKVINEIEKRLRNFLWKGTTSSGYAKVAWKDVCRPTDEGGLGFKDISTLNRALMSKKLCDVIRCDRTSIWVQWLYQDRLRDTSIWTVREHGGSWGWRKMLRLRPFLRSIVDYQIGNGDRFFVWQDPWHHLGPLIERFPRGPRHLRLEESAKLSAVISAGEWQWPTITDFECLEITHNLPLILGGEDRVVWRCDEGKPTTQALYRLFDPPEPKVGWSSLLSGSLKIPRHSFILWLAILGKLPTTDKSWLSHLGFSRQCLFEIRRWIRFHWPNRDWGTDIEWATRKWRGKHIIYSAYRTLLASCVYHIWRERNLRRFEKTERTPATLSILIVDDVRQRILSVDLTSSVSTRALYRLWRIPWLGFADDILLSCKADIDSIRVFKVGLDRFAEWSGLRLNVQKSHLIISRSAQEWKDQMLAVLGSQEGHLPIRYRGLPLISSRLTIADCQPLLSKMDARIMGWEGLSLSYAGRVQIIKSVLSSYWASAFILPKKIIKEIKKRMRNFLWKGTTTSGYAKVAWIDVCRPVEEGGTWIQEHYKLEQGIMSKKLCDVIRCDRTSIWVQWLYHDRLRDTSIWTIRDHGGSWGWRKLLRLHPFLRSSVDYQIGNGDTFYIWQDPWHHLGPLIERFPRGPRLLGINESTKLSYVISEGEWHWPPITDFECLEITHTLPQICGGADRVVWRFDKGQPTTQALYKLIGPPGPKVGWSSLLSGSLKIPRHAFILWLAILGKLPTTDKPWLSHLGACILCDDGSTETHSHLFFQCRFSRQCLTEIRRRIRFQWPNRNWEIDIEWATKKWRGKHIVNIAYRSLLAACVYHIWRERNLRRFEHTERTANTIGMMIINDVRQRILSINTALSVSTRALYRLWRIPWPVEGKNQLMIKLFTPNSHTCNPKSTSSSTPAGEDAGDEETDVGELVDIDGQNVETALVGFEGEQPPTAAEYEGSREL
ncbi:UNVERIFIED_CONTAM: LINE-1 retrotransposable element ORF2 protein [Sesamum indicum]